MEEHPAALCIDAGSLAFSTSGSESGIESRSASFWGLGATDDMAAWKAAAKKRQPVQARIEIPFGDIIKVVEGLFQVETKRRAISLKSVGNIDVCWDKTP
jgi:hypothetical protein